MHIKQQTRLCDVIILGTNTESACSRLIFVSETVLHCLLDQDFCATTILCTVSAKGVEEALKVACKIILNISCTTVHVR